MQKKRPTHLIYDTASLKNKTINCKKLEAYGCLGHKAAKFGTIQDVV